MTDPDSNGDAQAMRDEALAVIDRHLSPAIDGASRAGENPAVVLYALLECAMRIAQAHFPEHAGNIYASATQMVYEVHDRSGDEPGDGATRN